MPTLYLSPLGKIPAKSLGLQCLRDPLIQASALFLEKVLPPCHFPVGCNYMLGPREHQDSLNHAYVLVT